MKGDENETKILQTDNLTFDGDEINAEKRISCISRATLQNFAIKQSLLVPH